MIYNWSDTANDCIGTLYDNGGANGNYSNNTLESFYIMPQDAITLEITFSSFSVQSSYDHVRIYDNVSGNQIGSYSGNNLPNGGAPIIVPSGEAMVVFFSNSSVNGAGFSLNWSTGATGLINPSFIVSDPNPAVLEPVVFNNTSTEPGSTFWWDFGDGDTTVVSDPIHSYSSPGSYVVSLYQKNCFGTDTITDTINVQAYSVVSISPNSVSDSVLCGGVYFDTLHFNYLSGGRAFFDINVRSLADIHYLAADYETPSSQLQISPTAPSGFSANLGTGQAGQGTGFVTLSGYAGISRGLYADVYAPDANYFSYRVSVNQNSDSYLLLGDLGSDGITRIVLGLQVKNGSLRILGNTNTSVPISVGDWHLVEVKNLNYNTRKCDVYLDGVLARQNVGFKSASAMLINRIDIANFKYNVDVSYDDIRLMSYDDVSNISLSNLSGTTVSSVDIPFSINLSGINAGLRQYVFEVANSSAGPDSIIEVPIDIQIIGYPEYSANKSCMDFKTVLQGIASQDSVLIYNTGCDTIRFSSLTTSNQDFQPQVDSLYVAPTDSAWLVLDFLSQGRGSFNDTLFLSGNVDTSICLLAEVFMPPNIAFDSAVYNVNYYGCGDSVPFDFYVKNLSLDSTMSWHLRPVGIGLMDDFESGFNSKFWSTLGSNQISNSCYKHSGQNALKTTGTNRTAETVMLPIQIGDSVGFWVSPGTGGICNWPANNRTLLVEYRLKDSTNWNTIGTVNNTVGYGAYLKFAIPESGQMQIRLYQSSYSSATVDNYLIDDFQILYGSVWNGLSPNSDTVQAGDSVLVSGYLSISGLLDGNYNRWIRFQSNDPFYPDTLFQINLNINGNPKLWASSSCIIYDTLFTGASIKDSILIMNEGCKDLDLTGFSLGSSQFVHTLSPQILQPGDSIWLGIRFVPDGSVLGQIRDTLTITNNDSIFKLCLEAFAEGAPIGSLSPDSISVSITVCNDSLSIPVYLKNDGLSPLDFKYLKGSATGAKTKVGIVSSGVYSSERTNIYNIIQSLPNVKLVSLTGSTTADMAQELDSIDVLVLPESNSLSLSTTFSQAYRDFTNAGGFIIICYQSPAISSAYNIMPINLTTASFGTSAISLPSHPIVAGLNGATINIPAGNQRVAYVDTSGLDRIIGATGPDRAMVAAQAYGSGMAVHIGFDYNFTTPDAEQILKNAVVWGAGLKAAPDYISVNPDSGQVAIGDSVLLHLGINSAGVSNGNYNYYLFFETNEPINNPLRLPLHIEVSSVPIARAISNSCVSFGPVFQRTSLVDTFKILNEGCDTLRLSSYLANNSEYSIQNLPLDVAPGDTVMLKVLFSPLGTGLSTDTLELYSNDTTVFICVDGTGIGAPLPFVVEDTIKYQLQQCKQTGIKQVQVKNIGQDQMNYSAQFGVYAESSQLPFSGYGGRSQHIFNDLPSVGDSIKLRIILNGDFDSFFDRANLNINGSFWQTIYDNDRYYQLDTFEIVISGAQLNSILSVGSLDVLLINTVSVFGGPGSFHKVEMEFYHNVNWISIVGTSTGLIPAIDSTNLDLQFDASTLALGTYYSTLVINSDSPDKPSYHKHIEFDVISESDMKLSDTCASFPLTMLGDTSIQSITIYNEGCSPLVISSLTATSSQIKLSQSSVTIPAQDSIVLTIEFIPSNVGNLSASIYIVSNDTNRSICLNGIAGSFPVADFSFSDENICIGEVSFDNSSSMYFNTLSWDFGDGTTSTQINPNHVFSAPGTYQVTLYSINSIGVDSISKAVTVNPLVVNYSIKNDTIQLSDTAFFTDSTPNAVSWLWDFGDGTSSTQQNASHQYMLQGLFNVKLTVIDGRSCSNLLSKQIRVENKVGLYDWQLIHNWSLYPNPNDGQFKLQMDQGNWLGLEVHLLDSQGRVLSIRKGGLEPEIEFNLRLAKGVYQLLIVKQGQLMDQGKVLIQY